MANRMSEEKWDTIKAYLNKVWKEPGKYPDKGLLLSLSDEEITQIFTKERLKLVRLIQDKKPKNATRLSELAERRLSAVMRDLELLQHFHMVELQKKGKNIIPTVKKEILILPLIKLKAKTLPEIKAIA
jgi:predicted transcriptional regulator